jgi:hypothetical protein
MKQKTLIEIPPYYIDTLDCTGKEGKEWLKKHPSSTSSRVLKYGVHLQSIQLNSQRDMARHCKTDLSEKQSFSDPAISLDSDSD